MGNLDELQRRLSGLVVLLPAQAQDPAEYYARHDAQGRPLEGSERGLHVYLRDVAPAGYVQLRHSTGLLASADRPVELGLLSIEVVAADLPKAQVLADEVKGRIRNRLVSPTRFTYSTRQTLEQDDHTRIVLNFEVRELGV
ncbi:hypothetical protein [Deinococcus wulumuqiensis]|uniref:hypothetical protein n=1 Tax=Deinococcus wulumuqiensis TaxID=980427 RepID=UPI00242E68E0|nr:hypothetical protein [Deinococcus wulumuqiensis]